VATASAATDTARAAAAERDVRCAELRVRWAGRGAARRAGQAAAAAAAAADGVAPAVRAAFGAHLKPGAAALGVRELRAALRDAGLACASDDAIATLHKYDADGDGKLDLAEFGLLVAECRGHEQRHAADPNPNPNPNPNLNPNPNPKPAPNPSPSPDPNQARDGGARGGPRAAAPP